MQKKENLPAAILLACILIVPCFETMAQNVTSPYSILGIGDIDTKDFGRYFASGNAALARRDATSYNFSNPASLTALPFKLMNLDVSMRGRSSRFSSPGLDTSSGISKDYILKRISAAFKVSPTAALAFGLRPFSSVNYQYHAYSKISDGTESYTKYVDGSGGINQVYISLAKSIRKKFSAGITASYLFGSLIRKTEYYTPSINLDVIKNETTFYYGASVQGGLQYYSLEAKKWQHKIGLTVSASTKLNGEVTTQYEENETALQKETEAVAKFRLPVTVGLGYTATVNNKISFSADANYYDWNYQKVNYSRSYTAPSMRISTGMEYSKKIKTATGLAEKYYLGIGASVENSYIRLKENKLWDYSLSFGGGYNIFRGVSLYSGLEIGNKGNKTVNQIKEKYTQFIFGLTLKDIWMGPKYTRRYD